MPDEPHPNGRAQLMPEQLRRRCGPAGFAFETTAELDPYPSLLGQERAAEALSFGLAMRERSFNVFVAGPEGTGKATAVRAFLSDAAARRPTPDDWCYVHNFKDPA